MPRIENVFFDRDGTLILDKHYLAEPDEVELLPGAARALARLAACGIRLFLVSNQSGIGRGYFTEAACQACQARLAALLERHGVRFTDMAYCPHAPGDGCDCRKPEVGLWRRIAGARGLDPAACAMVGDKRADVSFGINARFAATVLVLTGHGRSEAHKLGLPDIPPGVEAQLLTSGKLHWPYAVARDVSGAVDILLSF